MEPVMPRASDLFSRWLGESEQTIRRTFEAGRAARHPPQLALLIGDRDVRNSRRGASSTGRGDRAR
ncbi:MAG: hypothetical protein D6811_07765 [Alphaproteobacteria bacterium]|nr:MAG: hypothetical protein D6811_07765 [Alphaproteobacteria bacterium]